MNREIHLEKKVDHATKTILQNLRNDRVSDCHYINQNDSDQIKNNKRTILLNEINDMPVSVKNMFDRYYPYLLSDIKMFIVDHQSHMSQRDIDITKRWFHY